MTHRSRCILFLAILALAAAGASAQTARRPREGTPRVIHEAPPLSAQQRNALLGVDSVLLPWIDDVELGTGQWIANGMWNRIYRPQQFKVIPAIYPRLVTYPDAGFLPLPAGGDYDWWFGQDSTGTFIGGGFNRNQAALSGGTSLSTVSGSLVSPPVSLIGQTRALLNFKTWWEIEGVDANTYDLMHVEVSTNKGLSWLPLGRGTINPLNDLNGDPWKAFSSAGLGKTGVWTDQFFDLKPYLGSVVLIRFRFDSGDNQYNGFRGWFIDNIKVSSDTLTAPSVKSLSPQTVNKGMVVTVSGGNFVNGAVLQIDSAVVVDAAVMNSAEVTFIAPALTGFVSLRITNPDGKSVFIPRALNIVTGSAPTILTITPDSAALNTSVQVTITGTNFATGATVDFGGVAATGVVVQSLTTLRANSPATLAEGSYNVRVQNIDGLSDIHILGFKVFAPSIKVDAVGDPSVGKTVGLNITPPSGQSFTTGMLFYRQGGRLAYDSLALLSVTGGFRGFFPPSAMTIRGVEYWVLLSGGNASMTYPVTSPAASPAIFPVRIPLFTAPVGLPAAKYRMISAPIVLDVPLLQPQFTDDFGTYSSTVWRSFRYIGNGYVEATPATIMEPGYAHWLITASGGPISFNGGTTVRTGSPYYIEIDTGWTMIGNPFGFPVHWQTVSGGFALSGPYSYDGSQYRIDTALVPFEGYFVRNDYSPQLVLSILPLDVSLYHPGKVSASSRALGEGDFALRLGVEIPATEYRDTYNYVGFRSDALVGRDRHDAPKPPGIGDGVRVTILDDGRGYLENFKPTGEEGQSWIVSVRSSGVKGDALMRLTSEGTLPAGYEIHVINLTDENAAPVSTGSFTVSLPAPGADKYFKIMIGTAAFAEKESKGIPLRPVAFSLEQNYPNPFNPETTIRYTLAKKSPVTLEIYNGLGQRVKILASGTETTGTHEVRWNGTNDAGGAAASGVYFCRLLTDEFTAVRKLVLIR